MTTILEILKFAAIGIGAAAGLVGTVSETRDKSSGKLTKGGKSLIALIVASGVVAGCIQAIEFSNSRKAARADRAARLSEFELLHDLTHPLGDLSVQINLSYPVTEGVGGLEGVWLRRVRAAAAQSSVVINDPDHDLRPRRSEPREARELRLLVEPEFDVTINRTTANFDSESGSLVDYRTNLMFRTSPGRSMLHVHLDRRLVENQIYASTARLVDDGSIRSRRQLYGAEVILKLPPTAPSGARVTRLTLTFLRGAEFGSPIEVPIAEENRRASPANEAFSNISYVAQLTEAELGPEPELLP